MGSTGDETSATISGQMTIMVNRLSRLRRRLRSGEEGVDSAAAFAYMCCCCAARDCSTTNEYELVLCIVLQWFDNNRNLNM